MLLFPFPLTQVRGNEHICRLLERREELLAKLLKFLTIADNKDKLLKILQYVVKLVVVARTSLRLAVSGGDNDKNAADFKAFASTLSLARRLSRLGNWLPTMHELAHLTHGAAPANDHLLHTVSTTASLINDLLDDWICLQRGRLLRKQPYLDRLDAWSTRLWFLSVSIELQFTLRKLLHLTVSRIDPSDKHAVANDAIYRKKRTDLLLTGSKQICDWLFCWWELADWSVWGHGSQYVPVAAGLTAATIGAIRGWRKLN